MKNGTLHLDELDGMFSAIEAPNILLFKIFLYAINPSLKSIVDSSFFPKSIDVLV